MDCVTSELGEVYHGPDVVAGASQYIQQFQQIPAYANINGRIEAEDRLNELRGRMREIVRADFRKPSQLTWDHMQRAFRQIDSSAACRRLPYAALLSECHSNVCFVFEMQGLAYKLGMTAKSWSMQDLYHARKPGRNPQHFGSYRVLGLNPCQGRLQEELWCQLEPDMWLHTGHIQEGRCEALVMVAADLAVASARQSLHLPYGTIFTDRKEAFDSQWRVPILVKLAEHVSEARVWCIADDLLRTTSMSVVRPGMRSRRFTMSVGTVEGRKLSPLQFCLAQANPGKTAQTCLWGVGINQPMEAVTAFHEHQDGSTDGTYDIAVAGCVLDMIHDGTLSWDQAMRSASSDAERLALLDGASTISRALRSFVDDTRVAVASWGQAAVAVDLLERVASEDQYVYTQGKNKVVVNSSAKRRPLQLHGSQVEFADQHVQLGVVLDTRYDGRSHLHHILSRGSSKMYLLMLELSMLGLPMHALLLSVRARLLPSVAFGVELVVHILCSEKQLNSMQASWMKKITGCALVPRAVLLWELGFHDRLSAIAWARAIMLRRRSATDPRYGHENSILSYAEVEPSSWPAAVQAKESCLAIPPFAGVISPLTPAVPCSDSCGPACSCPRDEDLASLFKEPFPLERFLFRPLDHISAGPFGAQHF